ncbi:unnamed protein product [marine sediment metagenome]|uniref:Uncharacterized protein n=1 Tax=marine sediment metagenome TaxID=412755 RepID=X1ISM2_9ZZZZ
MEPEKEGLKDTKVELPPVQRSFGRLYDVSWFLGMLPSFD